MAFATKAWHNSPTTDTPISASALQDLETRVTNIGLGGITSQTGATYTAAAGDVVLANPASGGITVTLPAVTQSTTVTVVAGSNIASSNLLTISYGSSHIKGSALGGTVSSFTVSNAYNSVQLASDGTDWYVITPSAITNVQTFTANDTWTKPSGATAVTVICIGGGGGGGGGGVPFSAVAGAGGAGGAYTQLIAPPSALTNAVTVTIGHAGNGGNGAPSTGSGSNGSAGGTTTFGSYLTALGGTGGAGSSTNQTTAVFNSGSGGAGGSAGAGGAGGNGAGGAGGGGGGSGLNASGFGLGGSPPTASGGLSNGGSGTSAAGFAPGGGGAGGNGHNAGTGDNGGFAGNYGGGGGGGGSSSNTGGSGVVGAGGACMVITQCA